MVGDDQEIERCADLGFYPVVGMDHRFALGEAIRVRRRDRHITVQKRVERVVGVQVCVTPQQLPVGRGLGRFFGAGPAGQCGKQAGQ